MGDWRSSFYSGEAAIKNQHAIYERCSLTVRNNVFECKLSPATGERQ